eukprot:9483887-Pyramimonas_sp.AAC.1
MMGWKGKLPKPQTPRGLVGLAEDGDTFLGGDVGDGDDALDKGLGEGRLILRSGWQAGGRKGGMWDGM